MMNHLGDSTNGQGEEEFLTEKSRKAQV